MMYNSGFPLTFTAPYNELEVGQLRPGEVGEITIKVEVMSADKEGVTLMKHGRLEVTKPFGEMGLDELRHRIGTVEETELPINKDEEEDNG